MTIPTDGGPAVHDRFDRIEALLHRYPAIAETELARCEPAGLPSVRCAQ